MGKAKALIGLGSAAAGLAAAYPVFLRKRCLTWGATGDEASMTMPGDDLLAEPAVLATRAITVHAPADAVWPWLVQMGSGRGGAYTYDWIENLLGLDMHSAKEVLPEFQNLQVGETYPLGPKGPRLRVEILDPDHALVFRSEDGNWVWAFALLPCADGSRLVSRNRIAMPHASIPVRLFNLLVMEPGSLIMERRMLFGIKERAEALVRDPTSAG
ncbi:SRPBCC family protein [Actinomadura decatromicini]|uniref:SRPBCC family protein n=1 Tax=Actinomadura decatromicini TaxID=2604572 RepID=A0A5D3FXM6_9ACTN|nr:SRPBCC family protein [Actinomadura decatromicini]TYK52450.1 SRPBCC family protein [Actinomadura decatromicini]